MVIIDQTSPLLHIVSVSTQESVDRRGYVSDHRPCVHVSGMKLDHRVKHWHCSTLRYDLSVGYKPFREKNRVDYKTPDNLRKTCPCSALTAQGKRHLVNQFREKFSTFPLIYERLFWGVSSCCTLLPLSLAIVSPSVTLVIPPTSVLRQGFFIKDSRSP